MTASSSLTDVMTDLDSLIERLERAEGPSREMDCAIDDWLCASRLSWPIEKARSIREKHERDYGLAEGRGDIAKFTSSIDSALTLADPRWEMHVIKASTVNGVMVEIREPSEYGWTQGPPVFRGEHKIEAIARTIAALKARRSLTPESVK